MPNQEFVCTFAGHRQVFESKIEEKIKNWQFLSVLLLVQELLIATYLTDLFQKTS